MAATIDAIREQIRSGKLEKALESLSSLERTNGNQPEAQFLKGLAHEKLFNREEALTAYQKSLERDSTQVEAAFRAALLSDQYGDEDEAVSLYERCTAREQAHVNALINLALLYEERGYLREAEACLRDVLAVQPNHPRARHLLKSVTSSYMMMIDERTHREREKRDALLDTPITEFELSVRSRNCLRQMNIRTLGDLVHSTEAELLAYKNFGETSLHEIRALLDQKGLKLGQGAPAAPAAAPTPAPVAAAAAAAAATAVAPPPQPQLPPEASLHLNRPVAELELSVRSRKCLQRLGVTAIGELIQRTESELMTIKNFGQTSLNEIKTQLAQIGLSLRKHR